MWTEKRVFQQGAYDAAQVTRMQLDLDIQGALKSELALSTNSRVIMDKGYAVDAVCHGKIEHFHYDGDVTIVIPESYKPSLLIPTLATTLSNVSGFAWDTVAQERSGWVKFYETGKKKWGEPEGSGLAQQLDVHYLKSNDPFQNETKITLLSSSGSDYDIAVRKSEIEDMQGNSREFETPTAEELIATKIRLLKTYGKLYNSKPRESDLIDLENLFLLSNPNLELVLYKLSEYYGKQMGMTDLNNSEINACLEVLKLGDVLGEDACQFFYEKLQNDLYN